MTEVRLAADTDPEVERVQIAAWRAMTPAEKAAIVSGLTGAAFAMVRLGGGHASGCRASTGASRPPL